MFPNSPSGEVDGGGARRGSLPYYASEPWFSIEMSSSPSSKKKVPFAQIIKGGNVILGDFLG